MDLVISVLVNLVVISLVIYALSKAFLILSSAFKSIAFISAVILSIMALMYVFKEGGSYIALVAISVAFLVISYQIYSFVYFRSSKFQMIKYGIHEHAQKCNDLNSHIEELKKSYSSARSIDYGSATVSDDSRYKMNRKFWGEHIQSSHIHNCSASVLENARNHPLKYFFKYFNVKSDEKSLSNFEKVLNDFSAAEQGKILLKNERESILESINNSIPKIIAEFSKERLMKKLGFEPVDLSDFYFPVYRFQYVSSGGNSSSRCDIKLDIENLEKAINYLGDIITFKKSIAGQRALMTQSLREKIKIRDNFTCKICGLSVSDEKNLLLEIDHIIPLSKGGITSEDNLQTLCWKCNRSKGSKIQSPPEAAVS